MSHSVYSQIRKLTEKLSDTSILILNEILNEMINVDNKMTTKSEQRVLFVDTPPCQNTFCFVEFSKLDK